MVTHPQHRRPSLASMARTTSTTSTRTTRTAFVVMAANTVFALLMSCQDAETPAPEPLLPSGLTASTEALLFGSPTRCNTATECDSGACVFGACAGLITVDEPWLSAVVGEKLRQHLAANPGLAERLVPMLSLMTTDREAGLPFRGRAARALAEIGTQGALDELERRLPESPSSLAELIATLLATQDRHAGLDIVVELSRSKTTARAIEGLRALGGLHSGDARDIALIELLSALSPDLHLEECRAALDGLTRLNDPRAILPLRRFLVAGPDNLAQETARALRALVGPGAETLGTDPHAWDTLFETKAPPAAPEYTPRRHESEDDLDLPTP